MTDTIIDIGTSPSIFLAHHIYSLELSLELLLELSLELLLELSLELLLELSLELSIELSLELERCKINTLYKTKSLKNINKPFIFTITSIKSIILSLEIEINTLKGKLETGNQPTERKKRTSSQNKEL